MPPITLVDLDIGNVVEIRVYGKASGQQIINRFFYRIQSDTGFNGITTADMAERFRTKWQSGALGYLPDYYGVIQYWAGRVAQVTPIVGPPARYKPVYDQEAVFLGTTADNGSGGVTGYLPLTDTATMQRFGEIRNKHFRSAVHFGPIKESDQSDGILEAAAQTAFKTDWELQFRGLLFAAATSTHNAYSVVFSYSLGVAESITTMDNATQNIEAWVPNAQLGTQRSRKQRAAGY